MALPPPVDFEAIRMAASVEAGEVHPAPIWYRLGHWLFRLFFPATRAASAEEAIAAEQFRRTVEDLQARLASALAAVDNREVEIRLLREELEKSRSAYRVAEFEMQLLQSVNERDMERVKAETAEAAAKRAMHETVRPA